MNCYCSHIWQDGFADGDELFRVIGREPDAFEEAGFFYQQNVAAEIAIIKFDSPHGPSRTGEKCRADFDGLNFICRHNECVKEKPRLQFEPVAVDAILLP